MKWVILLSLFIFALVVCCSRPESLLRFHEQTYLRISQPVIDGPFVIEDAIPDSVVMWTYMHHRNSEVTIDIYDVVKLVLRQRRIGHLEEVKVYCDLRLCYICHYIDQRKREKLVTVILSESSFKIAQTPFSRCSQVT